MISRWANGCLRKGCRIGRWLPVSIRCSINGVQPMSNSLHDSSPISPNRRSSDATASLCCALNSFGSFTITSETASLLKSFFAGFGASFVWQHFDFRDSFQTGFFAHELLVFANVHHANSLLAFISTRNKYSTDVQSWLQKMSHQTCLFHYWSKNVTLWKWIGRPLAEIWPLEISPILTKWESRSVVCRSIVGRSSIYRLFFSHILLIAMLGT